MNIFYTEKFFLENTTEFFDSIKKHKDDITQYVSLGFLLFFVKRHYFSNEIFFKKNIPNIFKKLSQNDLLFFINQEKTLVAEENYINDENIHIEDKIIFSLYDNNTNDIDYFFDYYEEIFSKQHIFNILLYFNYSEKILDLIKEEELSQKQILQYLSSSTASKVIDFDELLEYYPDHDIIKYLIINFILDDETKIEIEHITGQCFEDVEEIYKNKKSPIVF